MSLELHPNRTRRDALKIGGLTVATAVALRDAGHPLPDRLGLLSPWAVKRLDELDVGIVGFLIQSYVFFGMIKNNGTILAKAV